MTPTGIMCGQVSETLFEFFGGLGKRQCGAFHSCLTTMYPLLSTLAFIKLPYSLYSIFFSPRFLFSFSPFPLSQLPLFARCTSDKVLVLAPLRTDLAGLTEEAHAPRFTRTPLAALLETFLPLLTTSRLRKSLARAAERSQGLASRHWTLLPDRWLVARFK